MIRLALLPEYYCEPLASRYCRRCPPPCLSHPRSLQPWPSALSSRTKCGDHKDLDLAQIPQSVPWPFSAFSIPHALWSCHRRSKRDLNITLCRAASLLVSFSGWISGCAGCISCVRHLFQAAARRALFWIFDMTAAVAHSRQTSASAAPGSSNTKRSLQGRSQSTQNWSRSDFQCNAASHPCRCGDLRPPQATLLNLGTLKTVCPSKSYRTWIAGSWQSRVRKSP